MGVEGEVPLGKLYMGSWVFLNGVPYFRSDFISYGTFPMSLENKMGLLPPAIFSPISYTYLNLVTYSNCGAGWFFVFVLSPDAQSWRLVLHIVFLSVAALNSAFFYIFYLYSRLVT